MRSPAARLAPLLTFVAAAIGCRASGPDPATASRAHLSSGIWGTPTSAAGARTCRDPDRLARVVLARDALARDAHERGAVGAIVVETSGECGVTVLFASDGEARAYAPPASVAVADVPWSARVAVPDEVNAPSAGGGAP